MDRDPCAFSLVPLPPDPLPTPFPSSSHSPVDSYPLLPHHPLPSPQDTPTYHHFGPHTHIYSHIWTQCVYCIGMDFLAGLVVYLLPFGRFGSPLPSHAAAWHALCWDPTPVGHAPFPHLLPPSQGGDIAPCMGPFPGHYHSPLVLFIPLPPALTPCPYCVFGQDYPFFPLGPGTALPPPCRHSPTYCPLTSRFPHCAFLCRG